MAWPEMDWGGTSRPPPYRRPALIERRIAAVLAAVPRVDRAPASAGPRRLAPLRARPALGVSVGEQQSHYCDTEQNKTDRAHGSSSVRLFHRMLCDCSRYLGCGGEGVIGHDSTPRRALP